MSDKKFVGLKFHGKLYKVQLNSSSSHLEQLQAAFEEKLRKDTILTKMLSNVEYVGFSFKISDPDLGGSPRDLEDNDVLEDRQFVDVTVISPIKPKVRPPALVDANAGPSISSSAVTVHTATIATEEDILEGDFSFSDDVDFRVKIEPFEGASSAVNEGEPEATDLSEMVDSSSLNLEVSDNEDDPGILAPEKGGMLPIPYVLPRLPGCLISKMEDPRPLSDNIRCKIVRILAKDLFTLVKYPSKQEYDQVCNTVMRTWPKVITGYGQPMKAFRVALRKRMKLERQHTRMLGDRPRC